jgi:CheY-like chemotaxis protein
MDFSYAGLPNPIPQSALPSVPSPSRAPGAILIVEDEALVRAAALGVFANAGYRVIEAVSGEEAVEVLEGDCDVQLLFTDVNLMGLLEGLPLARQVHDRWPHIRIIVVSGQAMPQPCELPAGSRFYRKPYDAETMVRHVREMTAA